LAGALAILLLVTAANYFLFFAVPGDPARLSCGKICPPDLLAQVRHNLGYDRPLVVQYWDYLRGIFAGRTVFGTHCAAPCLGYSVVRRTPVLDQILGRYPVTLSLIVGTIVLFLGVGLTSGIVAARRRGSWIDKSVTGFSLVGQSVQIYFLGPLIVWALVYQLGILGQPGYVSPLSDPGGWFTGMLIPWLTLSFLYIATYARYGRSAMIEAMDEDYVRTARAKGLGQRTVLLKYAWRGAMTPIATLFALDLGVLLGGGILTEVVFNLPGIGQLAANAVTQDDLPVMMGCVLVASIGLVLANLIVDLCYALIDPRVRVA
jgi:peptide/nickel transport system permease protein